MKSAWGWKHPALNAHPFQERIPSKWLAQAAESCPCQVLCPVTSGDPLPALAVHQLPPAGPVAAARNPVRRHALFSCPSREGPAHRASGAARPVGGPLGSRPCPRPPARRCTGQAGGAGPRLGGSWLCAAKRAATHTARKAAGAGLHPRKSCILRATNAASVSNFAGPATDCSQRDVGTATTLSRPTVAQRGAAPHCTAHARGIWDPQAHANRSYDC